MDDPQPTKRAAAFMAANAKSVCVIGSAHVGGGATYTLEDQTVYTLSAEDCRSLPDNWHPRWLHGQ